MMRKGVRLVNCTGAGSTTRRRWSKGSRAGTSAAWPSTSIRPSPAPTARCSACRTCSARPHLGASTEEAQSNVAVEAAELLINFFTTGAIKPGGQHVAARSEDAGKPSAAT